MTRAEKRLEREYKSFVASPLDYIQVNFEKGTSLEWHFLFMGQVGTPFEGGEYHGTLVFPENYPFSPPSTRFITPNGRFQTDERVCFSISDFHPENWKPAYTMSAFLQGVYSFMMTETTDTVGSLERNENEIRELAGKSREFNLKDGSAELFQNENKAAQTENSDTDPIPFPINEPDISSQKGRSCFSTDMLEPDVSSKETKPDETIDTVINLGMDKNGKMRLASTSRECAEDVSACIDFFQSQPENVNPLSSQKTKHTTRPNSKQSFVITQPSTITVDQFILPDHVVNNSVSSDSISDPSQQSVSNGVNNSKVKQEDNVTSTSEPPETSEHLATDTVLILDMDEEEIEKRARMSKEFNKNDGAYNKMSKEEFDETIESSLNNFPTNNKREHILCQAKYSHQLNTVKSPINDFETLSPDYILDKVRRKRNRRLQLLNRVPIPNRNVPQQYYSKHKPMEQLLQVHMTDLLERSEQVEHAVRHLCFKGHKKLDKIFSNCITHTPANAYVNTFDQMFRCARKEKNGQIQTPISFQRVSLEESRSNKGSTTDKLVTYPRLRSKTVPVQTSYRALSSNNRSSKIIFVKSNSVERISLEYPNERNMTDQFLTHPPKNNSDDASRKKNQSRVSANSHWLNRAIKRLLSEFRKISDDPSDNIRVNFKEDKFLEWHFLFKGLKETFFEGGEYHGMLKFPENYPFSPPLIQFFTPNGRFKTNERVYFILSDFHPDCWNPSYTVSAVLQGAYTFMMSETTETVGSLIIDRNVIINLARMSKEFNRNNDTFNELFKEKNDEDIESSLNNSDDANRKKNIELPSHLIQIPETDTTEPTQSYSTHKTNGLLSHLVKVDKEEQTIGQISFFPANTSLNTFDCPSNSDKGKESHTSKLNTNNHNSATRVRTENLSVRSSDYAVNIISRNNYDKDTSDIPKPNREVSSERSNNLLSQSTSINKSLKLSKEFSSKRSQPNLSHTSKLFERTLSEKSNSTHSHSAICVSQNPERSEGVSVRSSDFTVINIARDNFNRGAANISKPNKKISSGSLNSLKEFSSKRSPPNLSYPTDIYSIHIPRRSENVQMPKTGLAYNSLAEDQSGITSVAPDLSKRSSFRESQSNPSYTTYTYSANHPKGSEKAQMLNAGYNRSLTDRNNGYPSQFFNDLTCPADVVTVPFSDKLTDDVSFNTSKLQMPMYSAFNSSTPHQLSSTVDIYSSYPPTSAKDRPSQNTNCNRSMNSYSLHSPTSLDNNISPRTTRYHELMSTSKYPPTYSATNSLFTNENISRSDLNEPPQNFSLTSIVNRSVQKKSGNESIRTPPFFPPTSSSTNKHLHNSSNESIKRRLFHPPSSPINNIRQNVNSNRTKDKTMFDFSKSSIPYQTYPTTYLNSYHRPNSPAKDVLCQGTSDSYSIEKSPPHYPTSSNTNELFQKTGSNRSIVKPPPDSSNSSTAAHRKSLNMHINQSHSLTSAEYSQCRNTNGNRVMNTIPSHHSTSSASNMLTRSISSIKSAKISPLDHPSSSDTNRLPPNVNSNKSIVTPPLDSPVPSTKGKLAKYATRNRSISKSSNDLATSSSGDRKIVNTRDSKPNLSPSYSAISLNKRQQNYGTTRPILKPLKSLSATNCKTQKYTGPINGYGTPSSATSRSLNDKLKLHPNPSLSPKLTKSEDLDFNCGRKNALPGNIDSNLCLKKTIKISKSLETTKELPTHGSSGLSRNKYADQSITSAALKGSLGRSNERLPKSETDKKIDTDVLLKSNESKIESRKFHGYWK